MPRCIVIPTDYYEKQLKKVDWSIQKRLHAKIKKRLMVLGSELDSELTNDGLLKKIKIGGKGPSIRLVYGFVDIKEDDVELAVLLSVFAKNNKQGYDEQAGNVGEKALARLEEKKQEFENLSEEQRKRLLGKK